MDSLLFEAISLLPPTKYIEEFYLAYRPWIRDKAHRYYVRFYARTSYYKTEVEGERDRRYPIDIEGVCPRWVNGYGATPHEALEDFIDKYRKTS